MLKGIGVRLSMELCLRHISLRPACLQVGSRLNYYIGTVGLEIVVGDPLGVDVACEATRLRFGSYGWQGVLFLYMSTQ